MSASPLITALKPRMALDQFKEAQRIFAEAQSNNRRPVASNVALDAFNNTLSRIGWGTDNLLQSTSYPLTRLSWNYILLQSLYRSNWLVRKMIDSIAEDMMKNWIDFVTDIPPAKEKKLTQQFKYTATQDKLLQCLKWARLFGGSGGVIIIKGQKLDIPLDLDDVPLDSYRGLLVFDRWSGITPSAKVSSDINRPHDFGLPETYRISTERGGAYEVHASRVLRFTGRTLPQWEFQAEQRWGISEIEVVYDELKKRDNTSFNLATLVFRANIFELKSKGLSMLLSGLNGGNAQTYAQFYSALQAQVRLMSNQGMIVTDGDTSGLSTHSYGFAGIAEVYELFMRDWCAACEIPFSRMFGREGGLGQSNEGDEHVYYDNLGQKQKREIDPQLQKLIPVVAMSTWGKVPDDLEWKWNAIRTLSDEQRADLGAKNTTAVVEVYNSGAISDQTLLKELKQQSDVTGMFTNITDEMIAKANDVPMGQGAALGVGAESLGLGGESEGGEPALQRSLKSLPTAQEKGNKLPKAVDAARATIKTSKGKYLIRGNWTEEELRKQYQSFVEKYKSNMDFDHWLVERGKVYVKVEDARLPLEHRTFAGFDVVIENPVGSVRSGPGWAVTMQHPYGYIARTEGADGDAVDCFLGPREQADMAYVAHTVAPGTDQYDEDKIFLGFPGADAAIEAFYANYSDRRLLQGIETVPVGELPARLAWFRGRKIEAYGGGL